MLARQREIDHNAEVPTGRLTLVAERFVETAVEESPRDGRFGTFGNAMSWVREQARQGPGRHSPVGDRLILLGIIIVVVVSLYVFIVDPS